MKPIIELLTIDDLDVQVTRKPIKNSYLRICHQSGQVTLSIPRKLSQTNVDSFIRAKRPWIDKHLAKVRAKPTPITYHYISGELHSYQGQLYELDLHTNQSVNIINICHQGKRLTMQVKGELSTDKKATLLKEWYREQMKLQLPDLIQKWELIMGVQSSDWGVKKMTTRWGTCNTKSKKIWLSLELIKKPTICLEYVIVHELVHLLERKHNKAFYRYMLQYMPEWKSYDQLLKS